MARIWESCELACTDTINLEGGFTWFAHSPTRSVRIEGDGVIHWSRRWMIRCWNTTISRIAFLIICARQVMCLTTRESTLGHTHGESRMCVNMRALSRCQILSILETVFVLLTWIASGWCIFSLKHINSAPQTQNTCAWITLKVISSLKHQHCLKYLCHG